MYKTILCLKSAFLMCISRFYITSVISNDINSLCTVDKTNGRRPDGTSPTYNLFLSVPQRLLEANQNGSMENKIIGKKFEGLYDLLLSCEAKVASTEKE